MHKSLPTSPGYTLTQYLVPHPFSGTWNQTLSFKGDLKAGRHAESLSLNVSRSNGGVVLSARTSKSMYPSWVHTAAVTKVHIKLSHQSVRAQSAKSCCSGCRYTSLWRTSSRTSHAKRLLSCTLDWIHCKSQSLTYWCMFVTGALWMHHHCCGLPIEVKIQF